MLEFTDTILPRSLRACVYVFSSHSSLLKEPIPESLLCLCALGLVHGDATLATAALSELLKLDGALRGTVEEHCLLTCTLLALQGNYSAVQREASRAVFRYMLNLVVLTICRIMTLSKIETWEEYLICLLKACKADMRWWTFH